MHGLNTIVRINRQQQEFIDHVLSTPYEDVNLLEVWQNWKEEQRDNEPVQVHTD
jgi:hypothetical protein